VNPLAAFQVITIGRFWVIPEAHLVGAKGFVSDNDNPDAAKANNRLVQQNCGKQIAGVR